jgi:3-oxoadipate enol-lactonase
LPVLRVTPDLELHYQVDDCADPWCKSQAMMLLQGNAESGAAWFAWVPHLARHFRVVRPDMRGFGQSTPMRKLPVGGGSL